MLCRILPSKKSNLPPFARLTFFYVCRVINEQNIKEDYGNKGRNSDYNRNIG